MSRQQMARMQGAEEAKRIILQSDTLSSQEKDVLINNLDQSLNRFNLCLGKDKIAGSSEENPDTHQDNLVKIKVENKPSDKRAGALLQAAAKKLGMDVAGTVMFETSENLNMGVMCSGNNKEGYAPIITARDSNSKAHKAALLGDSLDGGGISQFGNADTPIYGQETPGLIPLETMLVDPQVVEQVFVPGVVEKIIGHKKVYPNIAIKVVYYNNVQFTWSFRDYDSLSRDGVSDFNRSILKAFNWRFMGNVIFDEFNEEEWGLAKLQALSLRQKARMMGWKQQLNSIRRFGYMDGQGRYKIRGIDNAIGTLPRMQATPNNGSSPYADPAGRSYTQFQQDFARIWTELQRRTTLVKLGKNRDEIVADGTMTLAMFPDMIIYLATAMNPTTATKSALMWLLETFPDIKDSIILDKTLNATATEAGSQVKAIWTPPGLPQGFRMQLILENVGLFGCPTLMATSSTEIKSFRPEILGDGSVINYKDMYQPGDVMNFVPANLIDFEYSVDQTALEVVYKLRNSGVDTNNEFSKQLLSEKTKKIKPNKNIDFIPPANTDDNSNNESDSNNGADEDNGSDNDNTGGM